MKKLESEFVPYPLALRMKALGFNEICFGWWYWLNAEIGHYYEYKTTNSELIELNNHKNNCSAPTWQSAFFWLIPKINGEFKVCLDEEGWYIYNLENEIFKGDEAVEKLIEIVEQKQIKK